MKKGLEHAQEAVAIVERIVGKKEGEAEVNNNLLALRIQTLADG